MMILALPAHAGPLTLTWADNAANEAGFVIERSAESTTAFVELARVGSDLTSYTDPTAADGAAYCYRVHAFNDAGPSMPSNVACGTAPASARGPALALDVLTPMPATDAATPTPTVIVTATLTPGIQPILVDAYIFLQTPDGSVHSVVGPNTLVPGVLPVARDLLPVPVFTEVFRYAFTGGEPAGTYQWIAALTEAGTMNLVGPLVQIPLVN
ncbi:MAG: hypothetical protein ACREMB_07325 [Candidatus Rokuibacteriota bacterium]